MALTFFIFSSGLAVFFAIRRNVPIFSPFYIFAFFCVLYSVFPLLASNGVHPSYVWLLSLSKRTDLIDIHLLNVSLALLSFSICYTRVLKNTYRRINIIQATAKLKKTHEPYYQRNDKNHLSFVELWLFGFGLMLLLVSGVLGSMYPWGIIDEDANRPELVNSLLAHIKILASTIFVYFFTRFGFCLKTLLFLLAFAVAVMLEGSRTSLVAIVIAVLLILARAQNFSFKKSLGIFLAAGLGFIFFVFVALFRLNLDVRSLNIFETTFPLFIEGMYGSYMCLQAYELISIRGAMQPTWGLQYFIDPIIFLVPRFLFVTMGLNKDQSTISGNWETKANQFLAEDYAPYGGFFFIADAFVALPYLGPAIVAGAFGILTAYFEKRALQGFMGKYIYMNFLVGFFTVFIKHKISGSSHFLIVTILAAALVFAVAYKRQIVLRRAPQQT